MDGERFDAMTGMLRQVRSRRGALHLLAAAAIGGGGLAQDQDAGARPKRRNRTYQEIKREQCEFVGGVYTPSPISGGGTCRLAHGVDVTCYPDGRCVSVCHVRLGCDCDAGNYNFCNTSLSVPAPGSISVPVGGAGKPGTGGVVIKPGHGSTIPKPGQGAVAGTGGVVLKRGTTKGKRRHKRARVG